MMAKKVQLQRRHLAIQHRVAHVHLAPSVDSRRRSLLPNQWTFHMHVQHLNV